MAYYPKYNKNKNKPKAWAGAALAAINIGKGIYDTVKGNKRRKEAERNIEALKDSGRLNYEVQKTYQEMVDEPIDQAYIEGLEQSQATNFATAMQNLSRDSRGALPVAMGMERQAAKDRLDVLGLQDTAKTEALKNLATAEGTAEQSDVNLAMKEAGGLQGELQSATGQSAQGVEGILSGVVGGLQYGDDQGWFDGKEDGSGSNVADMFGGSENLSDEAAQEIEDIANANQAGVFSYEEGGTTPDEFSHDTNPIDIVQDGEKIGEMTGDEIIMPPDDRAQIEELMSKGGGEELIVLLKELFSKYDSNVIEVKDQEAPAEEEVPVEEEEQAPVMKEGGYLAKIKNRLKINF